MHKRLALLLLVVGLVTALATIGSTESWSGPSLANGFYEADERTGDDLASEQESAGILSSVVATGEVKGVRLLVVDDSDALVAIWSNTFSPEHSLVVRVGHRNGPEHALTESILRQYQAVVDGVAWTQRGLVYASPY